MYLFISMFYRGTCLGNRGLLSNTGKNPVMRLILHLYKVKEQEWLQFTVL